MEQKPVGLATYWKSQHGKEMKAVFAVAALAVGFGLFKALPFIIAGLVNLAVATSVGAAAVVALAVLAIVVRFVTHPKVRQAVTIRLNNAAQKQRRRAIADDPIGSGEQALDAMNKNYEKAKQIRTTVWGGVKEGEKKLAKLARERDERLGLYEQALKSGASDAREQAAVHARAAEVRAKSIAANTPGVNNARLMAQLLDKVVQNIGTKMKIFADELQVLKDDLELKAGVAKAGDAARRTLQGPEFELLRDSIEAAVSQISQFEAGIEQFMTDVIPSLKEEDLRNGMLDEGALRNAEAWLKNQNALPDKTSVIESDDARRLLLTAGGAQPLQFPKQEGIDVKSLPDDFSGFFKNTNP